MYIGELPKPIVSVLERLNGVTGVIVKGGVARLALLETLIKQGKVISPERLQREKRVDDLDIILLYQQTLPKSKQLLLQKEKEVRERLGEINLPLRGDGIEPARGEIDGKISEETVQRIFKSRDLTINEVILANENQQWYMYYTPRCWRDLIYGVGILNAKDPYTTRIDLGRIIPSHRGFYRLFKFLVEGKVEKIWLPEWQRIAHLLMCAEAQAKGILPLGANLGRYALLIAERYKTSDQTIKNRWMRVLKGFGFTDLGDFERFCKEQKLLEELKNGECEFESELAFNKIIDLIIEERKRKQEIQQQRKIEREKCNHRFYITVCEGCTFKCMFQKCQYCTQYSIIRPKFGLPCNEIFIAGNWRANPESLRGIPFLNPNPRSLLKPLT